jgi:TonB-dependent receptor
MVLTAESQSGFLLYNDLADDIVDGGADWTQFFMSGEIFGSVKGGVAFYNRERDFASRRFRFTFRGLQGIDLTPVPDDIFIEDNIRPDGLEIKEETRPTDTYSASHDLGAAYLMADATIGKWRFNGGLRYEDSEIVVTTFDPFSVDSQTIESRVTDGEIMPALSATYRLNSNTNLRAAVSRTVNRPEFRELAPFEWTDVMGGQSARGNPLLETAKISSFDLRWEWFPDQFGVIAASVFYKDFSNPIERTLLLAVELQSTWINTPGATNIGAELEFRRDLGFIADALSPFMVQLNYTYVDSEIDIGENPILTSTSRPLVGQPDYAFNAVLEWAPPRWGTAVRLLYNSKGETLHQAGGVGLPDVYQKPYSTLDLVWKQRLGFLGDGLSLSITASNLTDEKYELTGGFEQRYQRGRSFGLGVTYTVF